MTNLICTRLKLRTMVITKEQKAKDKIIINKIKLAKAKLGCGKRFEYHHYENIMLCGDKMLCPRCERKIDKLNSHKN